MIGSVLPVVVGVLAPGLLALDADRPDPDPAVFGLVRSNRIFRPLPPYVLEQLVVTLERVAPAEGTVLMAEGEVGDALYLVAEGVATVHRGEQVVQHCGAGEHLGEIALLRDVPRTASVSAGEGAGGVPARARCVPRGRHRTSAEPGACRRARHAAAGRAARLTRISPSERGRGRARA